jgi:hypothetical protein
MIRFYNNSDFAISCIIYLYLYIIVTLKESINLYIIMNIITFQKSYNKPL